MQPHVTGPTYSLQQFFTSPKLVSKSGLQVKKRLKSTDVQNKQNKYIGYSLVRFF